MSEHENLIKFLEEEAGRTRDLITEIEEGRAKFWSQTLGEERVETTDKDLIEAKLKLERFESQLKRLHQT